jgi:hypothetical protein
MAADETLVDRGFLAPATPSPAADQLFAADRADFGYVMNLSHAWAHQPAAHDGLMDLLKQAAATAGPSFRQRGVLVSATAGALGDPHCSLAWGSAWRVRWATRSPPPCSAGTTPPWRRPTGRWPTGRGP